MWPTRRHREIAHDSVGLLDPPQVDDAVHAAAGEQAAVGRELDVHDVVLMELWRNSSRSVDKSQRATSPDISPQSSFVPSGENASRLDAALLIPRRDELLDPPAGLHVEDRDPRTRGMRSPAATSRPPGENANDRMMPGVRSRQCRSAQGDAVARMSERLCRRLACSKSCAVASADSTA